MSGSETSVDVLTTFPSTTFNYQVPNTPVVSTKKKKAVKKRKSLAASLSSASEDEISEQTSAYYLQLAVDNLNLAFVKETNQDIQAKIKSLITKSQSVILNPDSSESEISINEIQNLKSDMNNKFNQISSMISELKSTTTANLNLISSNSMQNSGKQTYAQALGSVVSQSSIENEIDPSILHNAEKQLNNSARSKSKTQISAKNSEKSNSKANSISNYRDRRLILLNSANSAHTTAEYMQTRDKVNQEFQKQLKISANLPVIAAITKSQKQQNLVLTTTSKYNADFLIQHEKIWQNYFKFSGFIKDKAWFKVIAHGISTEIFNFSKGLELLKQEIETFNGVFPLAVNWISSVKNRSIKKHGSIVIAFDSEESAQKVLKNRLFIAGISVRTAKFIEKKTSEQCLKCQKFGHNTKTCKNQAVCQFCAGNHLTRLHICKTCEVREQICIHTVIKCSNCSGNHTANSKECQIVVAALAAKKQNSNLESNSSSSSNFSSSSSFSSISSSAFVIDS